MVTCGCLDQEGLTYLPISAIYIDEVIQENNLAHTALCQYHVLHMYSDILHE